MATFSGSKSRIYVSGAVEATAGVAQTLNKSFYPQACSLNLVEDQVADDNVTGYLAPISHTRTALKAAGDITVPLHPDWAAWTLRMLFGAAASSAQVSPSTTVYEHTWDAMAVNPATFTFQKQVGAISTFTEKLSGNGISSWNLKSGSGKIDLSVSVNGFGVRTAGDSETNATPQAESYLVGVNTDLKIDTVSVTKGVLMRDWSLSIEPGHDLIDAAGSTDGTFTRFDLTGLRRVTADFTLLLENRSLLDDFVAETTRAWEFVCTGPIIDAPNALNSLVAVKLTKGRIIESFPTEVGPHGVVKVRLKVEALVDTSTGKDLICRVRNLVTAYA